MKLVSLSHEHLKVQVALPFDIVDAAGQLLLAVGAVIASAEQLRQLRLHTLMVDEEQTEEWRRGLARKIDFLVRQDAKLKTIAQATADDPHPLVRLPANLSMTTETASLQMRLSQLLRDTYAKSGWQDKVEAVAARIEQLIDRDADALLHLLSRRRRTTRNTTAAPTRSFAPQERISAPASFNGHLACVAH